MTVAETCLWCDQPEKLHREVDIDWGDSMAVGVRICLPVTFFQAQEKTDAGSPKELRAERRER